MKKLLFIVFVMQILAGCNRQHVFHTYYGDIDIDTMDVVSYSNHNAVYKIKEVSDTIIYYCPGRDRYFLSLPTNNERRHLIVRYIPECDSVVVDSNVKKNTHEE